MTADVSLLCDLRPTAALAAPVQHRAAQASAAQQAVERLVALVALVLVLPVLLLLGLLVRGTSTGPAVFRQTRVGLHGREFTLWKLRTMTCDAERRRHELDNELDGVLFKVRDDPRVTRVGRVLRRWSLDELPQLVNVVRGDMSLVGPRPALPEEVACYDDHVRRRLDVKPGITGAWQVSGRSTLSWADSVRIDVEYVRTRSLALDLRILAKTAHAVVRRHGAY